MKPHIPVYGFNSASSDGAISSGPSRVIKVLIDGGTANTAVQLNDSADDSGTDILTFRVLANDSGEFNFEDIGGVPFATAIYADIQTTAGVVYVWYEGD